MIRLYKCSCGQRMANSTLDAINLHRASHGLTPLKIPASQLSKRPHLPKPLIPGRPPKIVKPKRKAGSRRKTNRRLAKENHRLQKEIASLNRKLKCRPLTAIQQQYLDRPRHPFYDADPWRRLRYRALTLYGRRCMSCGTTSAVFHIDHIKPRSRYPELELEISNLQVLCEACNMGKGAWDETDWRNQ